MFFHRATITCLLLHWRSISASCGFGSGLPYVDIIARMVIHRSGSLPVRPVSNFRWTDLQRVRFLSKYFDFPFQYHSNNVLYSSSPNTNVIRRISGQRLKSRYKAKHYRMREILNRKVLLHYSPEKVVLIELENLWTVEPMYLVQEQLRIKTEAGLN